VVVSSSLETVFETSVHFDTDLSHYGTKGGVHIKESNVFVIYGLR